MYFLPPVSVPAYLTYSFIAHDDFFLRKCSDNLPVFLPFGSIIKGLHFAEIASTITYADIFYSSCMICLAGR